MEIKTIIDFNFVNTVGSFHEEGIHHLIKKSMLLKFKILVKISRNIFFFKKKYFWGGFGHFKNVSRFTVQLLKSNFYVTEYALKLLDLYQKL